MRLRKLQLHSGYDEGAAAWQPCFLQRGLRVAGLHARKLPVRARLLRRVIAEVVLVERVPSRERSGW